MKNLLRQRLACSEGIRSMKGQPEQRRFWGVDFIVNVVLNRDLEVVAAFGGDFKEAFLKGLIEAVDL